MHKNGRKSVFSFLKLLSAALGLFLLLNGVKAYAAGDVVINPNNFPDANFREIVKQYDTSGDGVLSAYEIRQVTEMELAFESIYNLKGIEYFTSLKYLYCAYNYLTSVDLSKNTELETLYIGVHEDKIVDRFETNKISSLDLSRNTKLKYLYCEELGLVNLNLGTNKILNDLSCSYNNLSNLNVGNCPGLVYLTCNNNKLTSLDVSKNTALEQFGCSNNSLTNLNVDNNTALTSLNCSGNKLTSINVSRNTLLWALYCSDNQLTSIDVSKNTKLSTLNCSGNALKKLDIKNNVLGELYCQKNKITTLVIGNSPRLLKAYNYGGKLVDGVMQYGYWQMFPVLDFGYLYVDPSVKILENEIMPTGINLNKTSATMYYGNEMTLTATVSPADATDPTVTWSSSNPDIATVANGKVKAKNKAGETTITAKTVNGLTATCKITVYADNNPSNIFADIKYGSWQYNAAKAVYDKGYMTGKGNLNGRVLFSPDTDMTRSQFVVSLYSMDGKSAVTYEQRFSDVKSGDWYASAVTWAVKNGITAGNKNGTFGVNGKATREQIALMFYKYAVYKGYDVSIKASTNLDGFTDASKVDSWAVEAIKWAVERGIISGKGNATDGYRIAPTSSATRIECAAMMNKFSEVYSGAKLGEEDLEDPIALPMEEVEDLPVPSDEIEDIIDDEDTEDEDVIDDEDNTDEENSEDAADDENDSEELPDEEENPKE